MTAPAWFTWAFKELGVREEPENRGPAIRRYIGLAHCGVEGDPWCAIFANAALEASGIPGTRSPAARSFERSNDFVKLSGPALGAIVTFWRGTRKGWQGHVGFYDGERGDYVSTLGGNEGDMVRVELLPKNGTKFGLSGYWWPRSVPLPQIGALAPQPVASIGTGKVT